MLPLSSNYFNNLDYQNYPTLITRAITNIAHGTAVTYVPPRSIVSDVMPLTDFYDCYIHCIVSQFRTDSNEHIFTFVPKGPLANFVYSPDYPLPTLQLL